MLRPYLIIFSLIFALPSANAQIIKAEKGNSYKAVISTYDSNRISVDGGFIVSAVAPQDGRIVMDKDEATGSIFVRLNKGFGDNSTPFTIFIRDSDKNSYTLLVTPANVPGNNITLEPVRLKSESMVGKSLRRNELILFIMENMHLDQPMSKCGSETSRKQIKLWRDTRFYQVKEYQCGKYTGRVFTLTNTGQKVMRIAEQEFYKPGVVAVSVASQALEAGDTAKIYVIEEASYGN
jgi:conjugal transfer pilus assembly protein TraK